MSDDLSKRGPQDRSRINLLEPHEVQYWADKFNVSKERLSEAVKNVGHSADAVERELKRLEPISKSFEEDDEAGKLDKAEEIVGVVLPANEDPALPLNPGEEALDEPASHVAA